MATAWDAFVSYARSNSERTAIAVQRGLHRFARPWNQRRAVRIFRDDSAMSTNPALWAAIEEGLSAAGHLILLLSPAAATSAYVEKEVAWWLDHKGPATILLVLDAGDLAWDQAGNRFSADSPVPACLREAFAEEPRWLDLRWVHSSPDPAGDPRFAAAMADLSAPIRGIARDDLIGEDLTQHRRVRRLATSAVSLLALLLVISIVSTVLAVLQRDDVLRQAVTLRSRQLASTGSGLLDSDLRLAQLLAVQGFRTEESAATREALLRAAFASPLVDRFVTFGADITAVATSADAATVAVGLTDGRVYTVDGEGATVPALRFTASGPVTNLRASKDGAVLLAATRDAVTVWDAAGSRVLPGGPAAPAEAVALSASGRRAALVRGEATTRIVVYDTATEQEIAQRADPLGLKAEPGRGESPVHRSSGLPRRQQAAPGEQRRSLAGTRPAQREVPSGRLGDVDAVGGAVRRLQPRRLPARRPDHQRPGGAGLAAGPRRREPVPAEDRRAADRPPRDGGQP